MLGFKPQYMLGEEGKPFALLPQFLSFFNQQHLTVLTEHFTMELQSVCVQSLGFPEDSLQ